MSDKATRRQMSKQSSLWQLVISVCSPSRRVWLVLMKTNQIRLDQSLPELTANRKLTSCQNSEISQERTLHTHTHWGTHGQTQTWIWTCWCHHIVRYISVHTQKQEDTHTHCSIFLWCSQVTHDFTLLRNVAAYTHTQNPQVKDIYKNTHKADGLKLELFLNLNAELFHFIQFIS